MMKKKTQRYSSDELDRFMVRLPNGMRAGIKKAAEAHKRTMNAEIIARLEASFRIEAAEETKEGLQFITAGRRMSERLGKTMQARLTRLEQEVADLKKGRS